MNLPELRPKAFFDLTTELVEWIFRDMEVVWEPLGQLDLIIRGMVPEKTRVLGRVMDGAYVSATNVYIGEGAVIEAGAFIEGPCYIGSNAEVRQGAYIRGSVVLLEDAVLGHVSEAKNSIFLPGAKAPHFAYVGDSILGHRVNLGAGTKLSNVPITSSKDPTTGKRKTIRIRLNEEEYDTSLSKMGAVLGDDCQSGCNSVLSPGTVLGQSSLVYPNLSVRRGYYAPNSIIKLRQQVEIVERAGG